MKKAFLIVLILFVSVLSTACINNLAVQELNNKAKTYLDSGDYDNAISRLKSSIDLDSTIFETHYNLGIAYTQAGKYPDAIKAFTNTLKLKPSFADAYYSMAVAQENYAQGIIDGTFDKLTGSDKSTKTISDNKKEQSLTKDDKDLVAKLLNDSLESYKTYLKQSTNSNDKQEIEDKINSIKSMLKQYPVLNSAR